MLERFLDRSVIITARTGLEGEGNIIPAQAFGHVGEPCNESTDPQACLLPAGRQTQRGRSPQCISETKDPSHCRLFPATLSKMLTAHYFKIKPTRSWQEAE